MGTLDAPCFRHDSDSPAYCVYTDFSWHSYLRHVPGDQRPTARFVAAVDRCEARALAAAAHVFTFGEFVRDDIVAHYGLPVEKVTAIGAGMGAIRPYDGQKVFREPRLLFVAKHQFVEKGGELLLRAFPFARARSPRLRLTVVGPPEAALLCRGLSGVDFCSQVPWPKLEALYREATLLAQPMLNDPWGQVFTEALVSRTPVLGLRRNALPEILQNGRHGFLLERPDPRELAELIVEATSSPDRLAAMAHAGRQHCLARYAWSGVAERIGEVLKLT